MVCSACRFDSIRALRMIENIHSKLYEDDSKDNVGVIGCKSKTGNSKNMKQGEGNMERCPICGSSFREAERICSACGYDASVDWTRYPTFVYVKTIQNVSLKKKTELTMNAQEVQQRVQERIRKIQTEKQERVQKSERNYELEEVEKPRKGLHFVEKGVCGTSATWTLYANGVMWIKGEGAMRNYNRFGALITNMPWKKFRDKITAVVIDKGITTVGSCAFLECENLSRIWIDDTVQELCDWAFSDCKNLRAVRMSSRTQSIGYSAFLNCESLADIRLPQTLQAIKSIAFENNKALEYIDIPAGVTSIGAGAFSKCSLETVMLPEKIERLEDRVFEGCTKLRNVSLPNEIKHIGWKAFSGCRALRQIVIPASVSKIKTCAFEYCTKLETVVIQGENCEIKTCAFGNCRSLKTVVLQGENCKIENGAFRNCPANIYWE